MHVENIANVASYALSMRQSLLDKVFFADKVGPAPAIVDYGCADGQLLKFMRALFPEWPCCGYDISSEMVAAARENNPGVVFDSNWSAIQHAANSFKSDGKQCVLVLSSIVHEVYSYGTSADIEKFWSMVFSGMWDYRDSQAKAPGFIPGMKRSGLRPSRRPPLACCLLMARMVK